MFKFWNLILQLELLLFEFVKSIRSGNLQFFINTLMKIAPWMFALDHHNYARWLPVHINEMSQLQQNHPGVYEEFLKGKFSVQKSNRKFSRIAADQNHEQMNAKIKGVDGAIGLTENETALQRWLICGPEISRLLDEFESINEGVNRMREHHDFSDSVQSIFQEEVKSLLSALEDVGNPSDDDSNDLFDLETKIVVPETIAQNWHKLEYVGEKQVLVIVSVPLSDTITKNKLSLFKAVRSYSASKKDEELNTSKYNVSLFSRLFIACQTREGDLENFFAHENQLNPPSLSDRGELRPAKSKSGIVDCLLPNEDSMPCESPPVDCKVFDGPTLANVLSSESNCKSFAQYA